MQPWNIQQKNNFVKTEKVNMLRISLIIGFICCVLLIVLRTKIVIDKIDLDSKNQSSKQAAIETEWVIKYSYR